MEFDLRTQISLLVPAKMMGLVPGTQALTTCPHCLDLCAGVVYDILNGNITEDILLAKEAVARFTEIDPQASEVLQFMLEHKESLIHQLLMDYPSVTGLQQPVSQCVN